MRRPSLHADVIIICKWSSCLWRYLLSPLMWYNHKSQGLWCLGLGIHWWRQSWLQWTRAVNNYTSILTRDAQGQLAVHCLHRLIGVYGLLTKSCPENILTAHRLGADVILRKRQALGLFVFSHCCQCHVQNILQLTCTATVIQCWF